MANLFDVTPRAAGHVREQWAALSAPAPAAEVFAPTQTENLIAPVRAWLRHAIAEGTPLATTACLRMYGHIRIGTWRPFTATQLLAPGVGFIWAATAKMAGLPVVGYDRYVDGTGEMRWRIGGLIPVMSARGADVSASAAGRLAIESVFVPTAFRRAQWSSDDGAIHATWSIDEHRETVELDIGEDGRLRGAVMARWGNPDGLPYARYPFGVTFESEGRFAGITIPTRVRAGWWWRTDQQERGEFFRATVTAAAFR